MSYSLTLITPATEEPLTVDDAKLHCRVDHTDEDTLFETLILAARETAEDRTGRQLCTATWELKRDAFPGAGEPLLLPRVPLQSITSIKYIDSAGTEQTWGSSNYQASLSREPGRIVPAFATPWPVARLIADAVRVRYASGYGTAAAVPAGLKAAMRLLVGHWYANREEVAAGVGGEVPMAAAALLLQFAYGDEFDDYG